MSPATGGRWTLMPTAVDYGTNTKNCSIGSSMRSILIFAAAILMLAVLYGCAQPVHLVNGLRSEFSTECGTRVLSWKSLSSKSIQIELQFWTHPRCIEDMQFNIIKSLLDSPGSVVQVTDANHAVISIEGEARRNAKALPGASIDYDFNPTATQVSTPHLIARTVVRTVYLPESHSSPGTVTSVYVPHPCP